MTVQKFTCGLWNLLPVAQFQGARRSASLAQDFGEVGITSRARSISLTSFARVLFLPYALNLHRATRERRILQHV